MNATQTHDAPLAGAGTVPPEAAATPIERFVQYALAFEEVLASDDWSRLHEHLTPDAVHTVLGGGPLELCSNGRDAVVAGLRASVESLDRRFDRRLPEIVSGPSERGGVVWMDWRLTLQREGLPDLILEGTHATHFEGGRISRIDEAISNAVTERLEAYLAEHDGRLRPRPLASRAATAPLPPSRARMRELVDGYARAKSRADVGAALAHCDESFTIDTVAFGIVSRDRADTAMHLGIFFDTFPDYGVELGDMAYSRDGVACWGTAHMSLRGAALGLEPTGRRASVPFFCWFTFAGDRLASERFFFDLATLCDGLGVPLEAMRASLAALRAAAISGG